MTVIVRWLNDLVSVVRKADNAIHWINHYPVDSVVCFINTYPLDSDLSGGWRYPTFEQLGPDHDKSYKSMKFGTKLAYTLPNDIRRGTHVNLLRLPF